MKTSIQSLKKLIDIDISNEELIDRTFTQIGAVEEVIDLNEKYKGITIVKITNKEDHPDSDRLAVYQIDLGDGKTTQVVAGDKTLEVDDTVAYFKPGTKVPYNAHPEKNDNVVSKLKLRGVESDGMLASAKELDINSDHTRVMRLNKDIPAGKDFAQHTGLDDLIMDIENKALANRGDCFGLIGIAREVAAMQKKQFISPQWYINPSEEEIKIDGEAIPLSIENQSTINCPRYMGIILKDVKVKESPLWLQIELSKAGIKPINNVVDITNYMMLLTAQPMHAFDYDKVVNKNHSQSAQIVIRQAQNGEKILALNDKVLELDDSMTVICDSKSPIAVAGIIGGADTQIDENTTSIILESANFNRYNIRKTSWKLGVFTDAVTRYTKAQDPNQCKPVLYQAVHMLKELADAKVASQVTDIYPQPKEPKEIPITVEKLNQITGLNLSEEEIIQILTNTENDVTKSNETLIVKIPTFRQDISIPEDIYEDIARIYGFNEITVSLPKRDITPVKEYSLGKFKQKIREILSSEGANELLTYNFVGKDILTNYSLDPNKAYHLKNAISPDLEFMRKSLVPSLFEKAKENMDRGYDNLALFELNIAHNKEELDAEGLPFERWRLGMILSNRDQQSKTAYYYNMKVYLDTLEKRLNILKLQYTLLGNTQDNLPLWLNEIKGMYNINRSAIIWYTQESKKIYLGIIGEISNSVKSSAKLQNNSVAMEIDLNTLINAIDAKSKYQEPSKFPKIVQDLCFQMDKDIQYNAIYQEILDILKSSRMYYELEPIDIYSNEKTADVKQITFRITLQSRDKTLEGWEYDKVKKRVIFVLGDKYKAKLI